MLSTLVFFSNMWSWRGEYIHTVDPGCIHSPSCVCLDIGRVLLSLYVECRAACHFPHIFWLGLDCVCHSYLELAVLSITYNAVTLMDFPYPVIIYYRQVAFSDNLHLLSSAISFPSRPSLRKFSILMQSFCLWIFRFAIFSSRTTLYSHRNFCVFEIQVPVIQLLIMGQFFVKSGPKHPTSIFVCKSS